MIPFFDPSAQWRTIESEAMAAIEGVFARGRFILGEECAAFECEFAEWLGAGAAVGVGSGTEALHLALVAAGAGPGGEVIVPANTCVPTVSAIGAAGATPRLVDVCPRTLTMDPEAVRGAVTARTRAIVPVHLYGHPCDMDPLIEIAAAAGTPVIEDCAQAHGARYKGRMCGTMGAAGAFSFYPTKNLGAYGDAGAIAVRDPAMAQRLRMLRNYGEAERYRHDVAGFNSRLDELQAALLRVKLPRVHAWNVARRAIAARYDAAFADLPVQVPFNAPWAEPCRHLYPLRVDARDALRRRLEAAGVGTLLHYPIPVHLQPAYAGLGHGPGAFPVSERAASSVLSLPLYPELAEADQARVIGAVRAAYGSSDTTST